jgi:DUF971 family protein
VGGKDPFQGVAPLTIAGDAEQKVMSITWNDNHVSRLSYEWLRWNCPCASCTGEGGVPGALTYVQQLTPQQTNLDDLQLVGSYGMTPVWQDGHHTGIFTFRNLRAQCPCEECEARRVALAASGG